MPSKVQPIPQGYEAIIPYISVNDGAKAIEFYAKAFGAKTVMRLDMPNGKVGHADLLIGGGHIMVADEYPEINFKGPKAYGGSPVGLHFYVEDVDQTVAQAVAAGATLTRPVADQFYGDRSGSIEDPFGHVWHIATHIETVTEEEILRRSASVPECAG